MEHTWFGIAMLLALVVAVIYGIYKSLSGPYDAEKINRNKPYVVIKPLSENLFHLSLLSELTILNAPTIGVLAKTVYYTLENDLENAEEILTIMRQRCLDSEWAPDARQPVFIYVHDFLIPQFKPV
ncbi:hypothetical protein KFS98_003698 [Salmonella enterica]|nr:hypothetical protein [Salmonella enterica]